ncbi:hypothetical protein SteCoe_22481 [Stentor coeruleus]|uniref:Histidine kinase n=1 Tax=Stentor coeruleus TaxID=5963 RepID=A0A1R2BM31_9CILI|nr:hypothetical protein SteCoe_22481 [Stentor coeruleus]
MKSEWWDQYFDETFTGFQKIISIVFATTVIIRLFIAIFQSCEIAFGNRQLEITLILGTVIGISYQAHRMPNIVKKLFVFGLIEVLNSVLKYCSLYIHKGGVKLFCLESTVLTIFFQTNIFQGLHVNLLIIIKHVVVWCFFDDDKFQQIKEFENKSIVTLIGSLIVVTLWCVFESDKRKKLKDTYIFKLKAKSAHKQLSDLLRVFPDGLIIMSKKNELKFINETLCKILESDCSSILPRLKKIFTQGSSIDILTLIENLDQTKTTRALSLGITNISQSLYEWSANTIEWSNEKCFLITVKDVTTILSIERIESENKSKTALIRSVSHELRTPINGINMILDELFSQSLSNITEKLSHIKICTGLLNFQIGDILDYSEMSSGNFQIHETDCNLKSYLQECANLISVQAKYKGLSLICKIDELIPNEVFVDGLRVQKVVMNLLNNAIKFTNKGSIELCAINSGTCVDISVKDTGIGIPKQRLSQIFEMFSDKSNSSLSGLGLHISKNILNRLGSTLTVNSVPGEGSIFAFSLNIPNILPEDALLDYSFEIDIPNECIKSSTIRDISFKTFVMDWPKVLIADDHDFNRMCLGQLLESKGIKYIQVINGDEAVKKVIEYDKANKPFSCIIMDCNMPVMDGWEATKLITNNFTQGIIKQLPSIIGHTAYSSKEDIQRCYDSGMIGYMLKPTPQEEILAIISKYV